jgi:hypothetical protein
MYSLLSISLFSCELVLNLAVAPSVSINGTLVEAKMFTFTLESTHFLVVPFTLTTVHVLNLALTHKKRITVLLLFKLTVSKQVAF